MNNEQCDVIKLCERSGYGFVMQQASQAWRKIDSMGAIMTGPCAYFTEPCSCIIDGNSPGNCNQCYGCGWQFKKS